MDSDTRKVRWWACARSTMLNKVANQMQHCSSHPRTKEMLDDIEDNVWWKSLTHFHIIQHNATSSNKVAKRVHHVGINHVGRYCFRLAGPLNC